MPYGKLIENANLNGVWFHWGIMGDIQSNTGSKASTPSEEGGPILFQRKVCRNVNLNFICVKKIIMQIGCAWFVFLVVQSLMYTVEECSTKVTPLQWMHNVPFQHFLQEELGHWKPLLSHKKSFSFCSAFYSITFFLGKSFK